MYEIIKNPWGDKLMEYVASASESIKICSPFIKYESVRDVFRYKKSHVNIDLVTKVTLY